MAVANLMRVPTNVRQFNVFSFSNADNHREISVAFAATQPTAAPLPIIALDPISLVDIKSWLQRHQEVHNQMNAALGLGGSDLTDVDIKNEAQFTAWIELHFNEHFAACSALGIA